MTVRTWQWASFFILALIIAYEAVSEPRSITGIIAGTVLGVIGAQLQFTRSRNG